MIEWNKSDVEEYLDWLENHLSPEELQAEAIQRFRDHGNLPEQPESLPVVKVFNLFRPHQCFQDQ
jgi:hypothetical protein